MDSNEEKNQEIKDTATTEDGTQTVSEELKENISSEISDSEIVEHDKKDKKKGFFGKKGKSSEVEELNKKIEELALKVEEQGKSMIDVNDKYLRLSAEFDNYRKRTLKEKMELIKSAGESVILGIIPVLDDFDRALLHLDTATDIAAVKDGINLIYSKFKEYLTQKGVKEIDAINLDFNTDIHEAITKIPAPSEDVKGKVIDVVEKGYLLHDKVIRFSKVVVGE